MTTFLPDPQIRTERLTIRPFASGDADRIRAVIEARHRFLPPGVPGHPSGISRWLSHGVHELRRSGQGVHLAVEADGLVVGAVSLFKTLWGAGTTEIGYGVHPLYRGRGFAPEAVGGVVRWVFETTGLHRIELRADVDNIASLRVAEKAGFVREGVLRAAEMADDGPHDVVVFGMLRADAAATARTRRVPAPGEATARTARTARTGRAAGPEPERVDRSTGPEPERTDRSTGPEPERTDRSAGPEPERTDRSAGPEPGPEPERVDRNARDRERTVLDLFRERGQRAGACDPGLPTDHPPA
ncbi:GNAT family N-acetyltransferase [Streptosporangium fragile]|uniref:GNAT family N-acetyltransferase n=1 Tax=Streptosporangium fragile TaxID=46186 RepID=UPI0031EEEE0A